MKPFKINNISYVHGSTELIDDIEELWIAQRDHHVDKSIHFPEYFKSLSFIERKKALLSDDKNIKFTIAKDTVTEKLIGYSISTIDKDSIGEIFSLYVNPNYRGNNIGESLMNYSLNWMERNNTKKIQLGVAVGNEEVFSFYNKFGFYPHITLMERKG